MSSNIYIFIHKLLQINSTSKRYSHQTNKVIWQKSLMAKSMSNEMYFNYISITRIWIFMFVVIIIQVYLFKKLILNFIFSFEIFTRIRKILTSLIYYYILYYVVIYFIFDYKHNTFNCIICKFKYLLLLLLNNLQYLKRKWNIFVALISKLTL